MVKQKLYQDKMTLVDVKVMELITNQSQHYDNMIQVLDLQQKA